MSFGKKEILYQGTIINVEKRRVVLPSINGSTVTIEQVSHPGSAAVLPVLPNGNIVLIKQFRPVVGRFLLEVVAGKIDHPEGPFGCAERELREETGYLSTKTVHLQAIHPSPGYTDEMIYLYYALVDPNRIEQELDADENIELVEMPFKQALALIKGGEIMDAKTIITILLTHDVLAAIS